MRHRLLVAMFLLAGCDDNRSEVYALYRASPLDPTMRIHVATFDATESGRTYNQENCQIAADLFQKQPGVTVRYWCEKGRSSPELSETDAWPLASPTAFGAWTISSP